MINWKVRFKNWKWVAGFVSQLMLIAEIALTGLNAFGLIDFKLTDTMKDSILVFANSVFVLLSMFGIVQDPTTKGYTDSVRTLKYDKPK